MYILTLYVIDRFSKPVIDLVKRWREYLNIEFREKYVLDVVDILEEPNIAEQEAIFATPTLVKKGPPPSRRIMGCLTNIDKVVVKLDL